MLAHIKDILAGFIPGCVVGAALYRAYAAQAIKAAQAGVSKAESAVNKVI